MASLHKEKGERRGFRIRYRVDGKSHSLWLGNTSKRSANAVLRHVEELLRARKLGVEPDAETEIWSFEIPDRLRSRLVAHGLLSPRQKRPRDESLRLVGPWFKSYIDDRTDVKPHTRTVYRQAADWFTRKFGWDTPMGDITASEIDAWRRWMLTEGLAPSTANKHAKRVKKMLGEAVRARLLKESPAAELTIGTEVNRERDFYVSREAAKSILEVCNVEWAVIFGLCRFAGFRCPSEVLALRWSDVQWDQSRLRVESVKTGLRFCPIFPELRPILDSAWEAAQDGAKFVVHRYRGNETNLRTQLHRIIESAGLTPWPKAFVNLRASCRTDLEDRFPGHVLDSWLGHSSAVAKKHYLQTTDHHWQRAVTESTEPITTSESPRGNTGGNTCAPTEEHTENEASQNTVKPGAVFPSLPGCFEQGAPTRTRT